MYLLYSSGYAETQQSSDAISGVRYCLDNGYSSILYIIMYIQFGI